MILVLCNVLSICVERWHMRMLFIYIRMIYVTIFIIVQESAPNIKVVNPTVQKKVLLASNSSPSIPVDTDPLPKPPEPVRRSMFTVCVCVAW